MKLFCDCDHVLRTVQERLENVGKENAQLRVERTSLRADFEELQDKVYRWMQRTNKRARDEAASGTPDLTEEIGAGVPVRSAHPAVQRIQARRALMRERNGG